MMLSYCEHDDRIIDLDTWPQDSGGMADGRANCVVTGKNGTLCNNSLT